MSLRDSGEVVKETFPDVFLFENEGDYIEGVIQQIKEFEWDGKMRTVLTLKDGTGKDWDIWVNSMLLNLLNSCKATTGKKIGIEFQGMRPSTKHKGQRYKHFELYREKAQ